MAATVATVARSVELWALLGCLIALAAAGFFGGMAWMAGSPMTAARRWLRWALYPGVIWVAAVVLTRFALSAR